MPRSFNRVNSPHIQNINQFAVAPTPSFPPHGYITSSSPVEGNLPYRGQAVTQGQSSASTLNYPLSSPSNYLQINAAVPAMAEHANAFSYSAPAGTPDNGTQVTSSVTMWPPHAYPAPDPCHNSNDLRNALYYNPTEASTASRPYDIPAMGNNSRLPFSPQMQSSNTRTPDGLQQSSASYYPGADVFRSQPNVPTTSTSQPGRSHGNHLNHPSYQPPLRSFHGENPHEGSMHNSSRSHTQQSRTCCWLHENNVLCGFEGSMDALKAHFVNSHLSGPQDAQITCLWNPCHYSRRGKPEIHTMRRDSAWRHVLEKHLLVKYRKKA
ncbi:hypothetical protein K503DRAFT_410139 [Rhizopogon vinicolor AM-OR11-026]|uniref:Uncharacterized protein n=1 Tax=Rhizopogon vinicolor AM-OR11-026 TaxID=1314800 RepID=A0A1B7MQR4_9AGAM|nr:hypothetical protein K503DRAFT_410139 [Rhizopogon vinicolor AM-OR11-026]